MAAFRWIQMSSLLILMLQFKGTSEQHSSTYTVTAGHDVTLHCKNVIQGQRNCNSTTWLFSKSGNTEPLFELGKKKEVKPESDRLILSVNCSLEITKVKVQDNGSYTCRWFKNSSVYEDSVAQLSVINSEDTTTKVTTMKSTTRTSPTTATPTMKMNTRTTEEEVMTSEGATALTTSADTKTTILKAKTSTTGTSPITTKQTKKINTRTTEALTTSADWLWLIIASVGLAALLITVAMIIRWKKTKEKRQRGNNTGQTREPINKLPLEGLSLNPADTQCGAGTSQDTAEADDGVSYASITFTKKTKNKAQARGDDDDDDDDDTVTYSTVKASSSSTDHSGLYSTINKANNCS